MRAYVATILSGMLVWASVLPESLIAAGRQEPADKGSTPQSKPAAGDAAQAANNVKPLAACGFCLEDGTKIPLALGRELSSGVESTGNRVDFEVTEDIKVQDVVVIPKGSRATGTIVEAQKRRRLGRAGKLNVKIDEVRLADGSRAMLRALQENTGKGRQGVMTGAMIGAGILFFPAAPLFLFMRGKDIVIAKGTPVTSYIDGNTELNAAKFQATPKPSEAEPVSKDSKATTGTTSTNPPQR